MSWPRFADLGRLPIPGTDGPAHVRFTPDGSGLTYLQAADAGSVVQSLWRHDTTTGERTILAAPLPQHGDDAALTHRERLDRERRRTTTLGVTEYAWLPSGAEPVLLVPMGGMAFVREGSSELRAVAGVSGADAMVGSPDGRHVAFVRGGDLWLAPMDDGAARRLTEDADDGVFNGLAEYAAAEELDRFEGMWWSRDSRQIAFTHVDERAIPRFAISHLGDATPSHEEHRYPFAGGPNAAVTLRIADVGGAPVRSVPLPIGDGDYLARVVAHPGGGWLAAILPRAQRSLAWFRVTADGGVAHLWTETADPWINLDDDTRILPDGRVLRTTEATGFRHLVVRSPDGAQATPLTTGEWSVTSVAHVAPGLGVVYFHGHADGATQQHLYRVGLGEPAPVARPERLSREPGWHVATFSPGGVRWADAWSDLEHSPSLVLHEQETAGIGTILAPATRDAAEMGVQPPELLELTAADSTTTLYAALYRPTPSHAEPPPCVVWVYAGPHQQYVKREWATTVHPLRQFLARAGVAVLVVDGRGSKDRGLAFEAAIHGALGNAEVADQAAAVHQLIERGEVDAGRVGIMGGSYGGFMTLRAMALEPELFRVGVAIAPVTSWDGYDTAYTERYLGTPDGNPDAYRASSALEVAGRITGRLLVIHGAIDENVHLRHSVRLEAALQALGCDVDLVILPADRHRTRTRSGLATRDRRTVRHLLEALGVPLPSELVSDQAASGS